MGQKWDKNDQNCVKTVFFLTFQNGPKWIRVTFKWSKMAPKRIVGRFTLVLGAFWPAPPSFNSPVWAAVMAELGGTRLRGVGDKPQ